MSLVERCDSALVTRGLSRSRTRAQSLIKAGNVYLNGAKVEKCAQWVEESDTLEIRGEVCPYVSRGGLKLEKALNVFTIDPYGKVCLDVGASTGGFTDVLLRNGASKVYALDVGTSQLVQSLRDDPRVIVMEQTNARTITPLTFDTVPEIVVMDVSFISVRLIMPVLSAILGEDAHVVVLIKPQFEAGKKAVGKNGIVTDQKTHIRVLNEITQFAPSCGLQITGLDYSPISGSDGNIEYLAHFIRSDVFRNVIDDSMIRTIVKEAFKANK